MIATGNCNGGPRKLPRRQSEYRVRRPVRLKGTRVPHVFKLKLDYCTRLFRDQ